jgi:hypothetical protein
MLLRGHPSGDPARADGWHDYVRMLRQQATTRPRPYFGTEVDAEKPLNVMALTVAECLRAPRGVPSTRGRRRVTVTLHDDTSWTVTGEADLDFDDPSHRDSGVPRLVTSPACCAIMNRLDVEVTGGVDEDVPFNVDPDTFIYIRRNATLRVDAAIGDAELYGEPAPAWWKGGHSGSRKYSVAGWSTSCGPTTSWCVSIDAPVPAALKCGHCGMKTSMAMRRARTRAGWSSSD